MQTADTHPLVLRFEQEPGSSHACTVQPEEGLAANKSAQRPDRCTDLVILKPNSRKRAESRTKH
jgi:hypothetical protein